jgi:hypothetical protein
MRKRFLQILTIACVSLLVCPVTFAASTSSLQTSVTLTGPTGVNPVALKVTVPPGTDVPPESYTWASTPSATLSFDPMTLFTFPQQDTTKPPFLTFLPDHFYSIDMAYTYGTGAAITQMSFAFTATEPAGQPVGHGLGVKATASFVRKRIDPVTGSEATEAATDRINKVLLRDVSTVGVQLTDLNGGWLRVYVGVVTKDPGLPVGDIEKTATAEVFSPGDIAGAYTGTLTISSL